MNASEVITLYVVTARVFAMDKIKDFEINIYKKEARETKSSYLWENRRLSKNKLLQVENHQEGDRLLGFRTYCLEADVEKAKADVVERLKKQIKYRYETISIMQHLLESEPTINIKEVEREED